MANEYQVLVGNIGSVYSGPDRGEAEEVYFHYEDLSDEGVGRAAGETVTMLGNGEVICSTDGV